MKDNLTKINIALAFDEKFIIPFYVLLTSIFFNNPKSKIIIHTIATGINNHEIEKIKEYVQLNKGEIYFYKIDDSYNIESLNTSNIKSTSFTIATYYRLFFPFVVPNDV